MQTKIKFVANMLEICSEHSKTKPQRSFFIGGKKL